MASRLSAATRWLVVALLMLALPSIGAGRGREVASRAPAFAALADGAVLSPFGMICHARGGDDPAPRPRHACCDDCALSSPPLLAAAPASVARGAGRLASEVAAPGTPEPARAWTPRLARGPPEA